MFRIGEFSRLTHVSVRMLRYYDEQELLKPAAIDSLNGYRYYAAEQIPRLQRILLLRDMDFSTEEIRSGIGDWSNEHLIGLLKNKMEEIQDNIRFREGQINKIETALKDIGTKTLPVHYNFTIKAVPSYDVLSLRKVIPSYYHEGRLWKEMEAFIADNRLAIASDAYCLSIYQDGDYKEQDVDIEICSVVDFRKVPEIPDSRGFCLRTVAAADSMACAFVYGSYENILPAYQSFANWLSDNQQYEMGHTSRQICHTGPHNESQPEHYLTEIQIPVKKK